MYTTDYFQGKVIRAFNNAQTHYIETDEPEYSF